MSDIRRAGHCVSGAIAWLTVHGFDWRKFVADGASEADLLATGDAMAEQVIRRKHERSYG